MMKICCKYDLKGIHMKIELPSEVKFILNIIQDAGYEAYAVGGCVRDSILGRVPDDWDITTSAKPQQIKELFHKTVDTGIKHGTVTVIMKGKGYEVTTYRIDGEYEDSRHPKEVTFTANLVEDLKRRDFTINAMAYNEKEGLIDVFGGIQDIEQMTVRCVGNAEERFAEDALRIMRAVRFAAQLGYAIEENTMAAVKKLAPTLINISVERIQTELVKLLISPNPAFLKIAYEAGITTVIFPEFDAVMETEQNHPHHSYSVGEHTLISMQKIKADKVLRLAMLFHDIGKPETQTTDEKGITHFYGHAQVSETIARKVLRRLKFDNDTTQKVCRLVLYHDYGNKEEPTPQIVRRAVNKIGADIFPLLFSVKEADMKAQSNYQRKEKEERLLRWKSCFQKITEEKQCVSLKDLAVSGKDLLELGIKPGKEIGEALEYLLNLVLEDSAKNTKEYLLSEIRNRR